MSVTKESLLKHFDSVKKSPLRETLNSTIHKLFEDDLMNEMSKVHFGCYDNGDIKNQARTKIYIHSIQHALAIFEEKDIPLTRATLKQIVEFVQDIEHAPEWSKVKNILKECLKLLMPLQVETKESDPFLKQSQELIDHLKEECIVRLYADYADAELFVRKRETGHIPPSAMDFSRTCFNNWPQYIQKCRENIILLEMILKKEIAPTDAMEYLLEISEEFLNIAKDPAYGSGALQGFRYLMEETSLKFQKLSMLALKSQKEPKPLKP